MKKRLLILGLLLFALAVPTRAHSAGFLKSGYKLETGVNFYFRIVPCGHPNGPQLGPWYHYWPLEAHFQHAAPMANYSQHPYQALSPTFLNNQFRTVQPASHGYAHPAYGR